MTAATLELQDWTLLGSGVADAEADVGKALPPAVAGGLVIWPLADFDGALSFVLVCSASDADDVWDLADLGAALPESLPDEAEVWELSLLPIPAFSAEVVVLGRTGALALLDPFPEGAEG